MSPKCQFIIWFNCAFILIRYKPGSIPVAFVQEQLGYSSKDKEEWTSFIEPFSLPFTDPEKTRIDCKASAAAIASIKWLHYVVFGIAELQLLNSPYFLAAILKSLESSFKFRSSVTFKYKFRSTILKIFIQMSLLRTWRKNCTYSVVFALKMVHPGTPFVSVFRKYFNE